MFRRIGALVMILAGSMAVLTPAVAQARDRDDYRRFERHDRREWREHEWREHEWREQERRERWEHRDYRPNYYDRYYYDQYGRPICR